MLKPAILYKQRLETILATESEKKLEYYTMTNYRKHGIEVENTEWTSLQYCSIDSQDRIIGFLSATVSRSQNEIEGFNLYNFGDPSVIFAKDLLRFITKISEGGFRKLRFMVAIGNTPAERLYEYFAKKYDLRTVGIEEEYYISLSGVVRDVKVYEKILIKGKRE